MLKRNWQYLLLLFLLTDLGYSFWQYLQFPLDGDLAPIVAPSEHYRLVLQDPFGLRVLLHQEVYLGPNRFFAHFLLYGYFRHVPLWLQPLLSPLDSMYAACALLKLGVHVLLVYVLAVAISNRRNVFSREFLLAAVLVTPLLQTSGFSGQMGVVDWSITYTAFYALPLSVLLLFFLPFLRNALHAVPLRLSGLAYVALVGLAVVLAFNGPTIPATVLLVCPAALLVSGYRRFARCPATEPVLRRAYQAVRALPPALFGVFGVFIVLGLYSMYIGRNNSENFLVNLPLAQRYGRLPLGVFYLLTSKIGFPLLLLALLVNAWLIRRHAPTPLGKRVLVALRWLGVFALVYVLLLPLGGYREYRHYIIRHDSIMPVTIGMIGGFALSAWFLLGQLPAAVRRRYTAGVAAFLAVYTIADKPRPRDYNACERALFAQLAQSSAPIVRLPATCTMMDWQPLTDYRKSDLNGQMLKYWGITTARKQYYQQ